MSALAVDGLWVRHADGTALARDISLQVASGQCLTVIGETGSGKSLVAQALLGILPRGLAASGMLRLGARAAIPLDDRAALRRLWASDIFLLPQHPDAALDPTMRIGSQVAETLHGPGTATPHDRARDAFVAVGLPPGAMPQYPAELSGGMSQRALVAMAGSAAAPVIIADEPTKGLDDVRAEQALALLQGLLARGKALLIITHDLLVPRRLGGEIAVMRDGAIVERQPIATFLAAPLHPYSRAYVAALPERWQTRPLARSAAAAVIAGDRLGLAGPYRPQRALFEDLSLSIAPGGVCGLVGPSGSGKTSLGDVLLGLRRPTHGHVRWGSVDPHSCHCGEAKRMRSRYQKLYQEPGAAFAPHRSLRASFRDLARLRPAGRLADRLLGYLERLKLRESLLDRLPHEVSGGEAQRLALARVLLLDPAFLVADEPTSRLDPIVQAETIGLLRDLARDDGIAILLISHNRALVDAVCDQVVTLGAGTDGRAAAPWRAAH